MRYEIDIATMEQLKAFAAEIAPLLQSGDVLALVGDIGAGKTTFTQSLFSCLGVNNNVSSPTYNIVLLYNSPRGRLYHADLYRIDSEEELDNIGFDELLCDDALIVVEWADKMEAYLRDYAKCYMELKFSAGQGKRSCTFEGELAERYSKERGGRS